MNWQQILPVLVVAAVVAFFVLRGSKKSCGCGHAHDHPPEKNKDLPPSA